MRTNKNLNDRNLLVNAYKEKIKKYDSIKNLIKLNKISKAHSEIIKYLDEYPDDYFAWYLYGKILYIVGDYYKAKDIFIDLYKIGVSNKYSALNKLGDIETKLGNINEAIYYYMKEVKETPNDALYSRISLSRIFKKQNRLKESIDILEDVDNPYIYIEKSNFYINEANFDEAIKYINLLKDSDDKDIISNYYCLMGKYLYRKASLLNGINVDEYNKIESYFKKSYDIEPRKSTLLEEIKFNIRFREYDKVIFLSNQYGKTEYDREICLYLGEAYEKKKDLNKAYNNYYISLESDDFDVKNKSIAKIANLKLIEGKFDEAKQYFNRCKTNDTMSKRNIVYKMCSCLLREKKYLELYNYMNENIDVIKDDFDNNITYENIYYYICKFLNKKVHFDDKYYYVRKQIIKYDKREAINHIINHRKEKCSFKENIDVSKLYYDIRRKLDYRYRVNDELMDIYYFDMIGISEDKRRKYLKVVCIPNTKKIITMYPYSDDNFIRPIDIVKDKNNNKNLEKSQVEKFNLKYKRL